MKIYFTLICSILVIVQILIAILFRPLDFSTKVQQPKLVLLWTPFFSDNEWTGHFKQNRGKSIVGLAGGNQFCTFTTNHQNIEDADGIVFHGRDFSFDNLPDIRLSTQYWVFYLLESPFNSGFNDRQWESLDQLGFNWTMSYAKTADVFSPYGFQRKQPFHKGRDEMIENFIENFETRPKDAVWIVSNCWFVSLFFLPIFNQFHDILFLGLHHFGNK